MREGSLKSVDASLPTVAAFQLFGRGRIWVFGDSQVRGATQTRRLRQLSFRDLGVCAEHVLSPPRARALHDLSRGHDPPTLAVPRALAALEQILPHLPSEVAALRDGHPATIVRMLLVDESRGVLVEIRRLIAKQRGVFVTDRDLVCY